MVLDDPFGDVGLVDRPELARERELGVHLVHHRPERLVRREVRPERDVRGVVSVSELGVLPVGPQVLFGDLHVDVLGVGHLPGRLVELPWVAVDDVHVVCLVVDLAGVDTRGHHEGRVHLPATLVREELFREVEKTVHQEHDAIFVAVTLGNRQVIGH